MRCRYVIIMQGGISVHRWNRKKSAVILPHCHCFQHRWFPQTVHWRSWSWDTCQASVWFSCSDNYCVYSVAGSLSIKDVFILLHSTEWSQLHGRTQSVHQTWSVEGLRRYKLFQINLTCFPAVFIPTFFLRSECDFIFFFFSPCREAIKHCHAAEDTCRDLSFTGPWASRTSWKGWITRPSRRARASWSSRWELRLPNWTAGH